MSHTCIKRILKNIEEHRDTLINTTYNPQDKPQLTAERTARIGTSAHKM